MKKWIAVLVGVTVLAIGLSAANASTVYSNSFDNPSDPLSEWSSAVTSVTPGTLLHPADRFLGEFGNQSVDLTLTNLPAHSALAISFDVYAIRTWDGSVSFIGKDVEGIWGPQGPDVWDLTVVGGPTLLHTTFSQFSFEDQAFPDSYPSGSHPAQTGAFEVSSLGYVSGTDPNVYDSVYRLYYLVPHTGSSVSFSFSATGLQSLTDESWGIDNVTVGAVPEPATLVIWSVLGGLGVTISRWRRKRAA